MQDMANIVHVGEFESWVVVMVVVKMGNVQSKFIETRTVHA